MSVRLSQDEKPIQLSKSYPALARRAARLHPDGLRRGMRRQKRAYAGRNFAPTDVNQNSSRNLLS